MNVKVGRPPNYSEIAAAFKIAGRPGIVYTYGSTLYNPDGVEISPDLFAHEETHWVQQTSFGTTPESWWRQYIDDPHFRLAQEVEAYRNQYTFAMANYNREQRRALLKHITKALAGPMYGRLVTPAAAKRLITT